MGAVVASMPGDRQGYPGHYRGQQKPASPMALLVAGPQPSLKACARSGGGNRDGWFWCSSIAPPDTGRSGRSPPATANPPGAGGGQPGFSAPDGVFDLDPLLAPSPS